MVLDWSGGNLDRKLPCEILVGKQVLTGTMADLSLPVILPVFRGQQHEAVLAEVATV